MEEPDEVRTGILGSARAIWRKLPKGLRQSFWETAGPGVQRAYALSQLARPADRATPLGTSPLVVAGLFSTANGIGEAARSTYRSLAAAGLSPIAVDLSEQLAPVDMESPIVCHPMPDAREGTLILQLNGPETSTALELLGMTRNRNWYTIGYWAWELPVFPQQWDKAFPFLSELWTISSFTADALARHPKAPAIHIFPHAISPPAISPDRASISKIPDEAFVFLSMADSMSSLQRKNPFATIRAFKDAFRDRKDVHLLLKTRNLDREPEYKSDLMADVGAANNISVLDESLSETERWQLLASIDCLVSLHRAEGFGLVLAEAMALGKPVITTGWSGNMDFTDSTTAHLVGHDLIRCQDDYGIYRAKNALWADAIHEEAIAALTNITNDRDYADSLGLAAKQRIVQDYNHAGIGERMKQHLSSLPKTQ